MSNSSSSSKKVVNVDIRKPSQSRFHYVETSEPHLARRKEILKKYPQIEDLNGPDIRLFYSIVVLMIVQFTYNLFITHHLGYSVTDGMFWLAAWSFGGAITHSLSMASHELSHNLAFPEKWKNEFLGVVLNLAHGIPTCATFKRYHMEHHMYQGDAILDVDVPCEFELFVFGNDVVAKNSYLLQCTLKCIWVLLQPFAYALRPVIMNPKDITHMEVVNFVAVAAFNILLSSKFSISTVLFNVLSTLLGMGLHPCAGHFIAEHYTFHANDIPIQETYSYYGPLNYITFNVGYHNEHHDFPRISGFNLPKVKQIAPEFYDEQHAHLKNHPSWTQVIVDYILDPKMGPHQRVKRISKTNK